MNWPEVISSLANAVIAFTALTTMLVTLVTLFFVYRQLREMTKQTRFLGQSVRSATYQSIVDAERELWSKLMDNQEFMAHHMGEFKVVKKYGISPQQLLSVSLLCGHYENVFFQFREGIVPKELWPEWARTIVNNINKPLIRQLWPELRYWYWQEFSEFVDKELQKLAAQNASINASDISNSSQFSENDKKDNLPQPN